MLPRGTEYGNAGQSLRLSPARSHPRKVAMGKPPTVRHVYDDIMSRHHLAERAEVLEMLCMPLADPLHGRLDGTAWVRRALEAAGIVIDERDADAFIKRAHLDLDPSDAEKCGQG